MMRRGIPQRASATVAVLALLAIPAGAAFADGSDESDEKRIVRQREILMASDGEIPSSNGWFGNNIGFHSKAGLAYTQQLELGERPLIFHLKGPVLKKQRALGLSFLIRF